MNKINIKQTFVKEVMLFFSFHPEQETEWTESFNQQFIDQHDGDEGNRTENKIFQHQSGTPIYEKKSENDNHTLVKDIERQYGDVGILQQSVPESEMPAPDAQDSKHPNPGIESPEKGRPEIVETSEGRVAPRTPEIKSHKSCYRGQC